MKRMIISDIYFLISFLKWCQEYLFFIYESIILILFIFIKKQKVKYILPFLLCNNNLTLKIRK